MLGIIRMIVIGLIVGVLARWFYPGRVDAGWIVTILLGIAGSFVAGFAMQLLSPAQRDKPFHPAGLLASIVGGMVLIFVARLLHIA